MSQTPWRIVFAEPFTEQAVAQMREIGDIRELARCDESCLLEAVADCDALLVRTASRVTRRVLEAAPRLRVIGRGGVGLDNVDLDAARERGVTVVYTPGAATDAVADLTFGLMLSLVWNLRGCDTGVREGRFEAVRAAVRPRELSTLTLGIVGLGRIGQAVARRAAHGFGMRVLYNDLVDPGPLGFPATPVDKDRVFAESDIVSLHVPLTEATRGMVGEAALARFQPGAILINTSRGAVVDGNALDQALRSGRLGGAGLDVLDPEPLPADHPLLSAPNTVFTPHAGARTALAQARMNGVVEDVIRVLRGLAALHPA
jgi:D-3-phosphoglycerate dehydrogenase